MFEGSSKSVRFVKKSSDYSWKSINAKGINNCEIRCRRAVCQHCASHQGQILSEVGLSKQQHRICNYCKEESDSIKRFVEQNKLGIGKDTFSIEWLKASGLTLNIA